ncbi:glycosyltransferase [Amycolatopsis lexingtonensis]|uniref:Glycosyltransferase n=1 Tax=Amycolatopsis lexingtonensis TaxID=218822 RepID=A0ABR9IG14_9PSEU|nr:nucleotide disphospho-sugar-binding domain-containing protein [Amycolatopsis lexingtonensis]MBE1502129.1 glycosyltransferase [Amycolatopsis lexingtonensis]
MRVQFAIWPAPAHTFPLAPLAWALKSAGHEVVIATHPGGVETIASMGITPVAVCDIDSMPIPMGPGRAYEKERADLAEITAALEALGFDADDPDREHWDVYSQYYLPAQWDFAPWKGDPNEPLPFLDGLVEFTKAWKPDLVIWDACLPAAAVAAKVAGAAHARWWTAPDVFCRSIDKFKEFTSKPGAPELPNPAVETVRAAAERYGVEIDDELLWGQWTINSQPQEIGPEVSANVVPMRWVSYSSQQPMPDWLYPVPERPRVAVSLGLSERAFMEGGWDHIPVLLNALSELDVEVVATLDDQQLAKVEQIPENVRVLPFVPLDQLVPTCSLLIHHGGVGTVMPAILNSVPQLLVDFVGHSIRANPSGAARLARSRYSLGPALARFTLAKGAGLVLNVAEPDAAVMREQIRRVLEEKSFKENAQRLLKEINSVPGPAEYVKILEQLTLDHQS